LRARECVRSKNELREISGTCLNNEFRASTPRVIAHRFLLVIGGVSVLEGK